MMKQLVSLLEVLNGTRSPRFSGALLLGAFFLMANPVLADSVQRDPGNLPQSTFVPGAIWPDTDGVHINAHGGGVLYHEGVYYWFGQHMVEGRAGNRAQVGISVYSSRDLYNWDNEGIALPVSMEPGSEIEKGCIMERPKVIYNRKTGKFVMWFHLELKGEGYSSARTAVAVSDTPTGPYTYLRSERPNAGHWPLNVRAEDKDPESIAKAIKAEKEQPFSGGLNIRTIQYNLLGAHFEGGQMSRDMTLFVDDCGTAYHIYASEHNATLHISELSEDYLSHTGRYVRIFEHRWMEAPAVFKREGRYYLLASGCTGWEPNAARAAVADSIFGPWLELENPCIGINPKNGLGPEKTFGGQSTFVLPVEGLDDVYIAMFDVWEPSNAIDGRYLWLPVDFSDQGGVGNERGFAIPWRDEWSLEEFQREQATD